MSSSTRPLVSSLSSSSSSRSHHENERERDSHRYGSDRGDRWDDRREASDTRDRRDGSERRVRDRKEMNSRFLEHRRLVREEMDRNGAPSGLWMESPSPERRPTKEVSPPRSNTNHAKKEVSKRLRKRSLSPSSSSSSSSSSGSSDADSSSASEREEVVSKSRSTSKSKVDYGTETRDKKVSRKDKSSKDIKESRKNHSKKKHDRHRHEKKRHHKEETSKSSSRDGHRRRRKRSPSVSSSSSSSSSSESDQSSSSSESSGHASNDSDGSEVIAEFTWKKKEAPVNDDGIQVGPVSLPSLNESSERDFGGHLLPGEGSAMANYVATGKRIPRRGEIGLTADEIQTFEDLGFVMSGSRHKRMNAVRIRKESQIYSAEEKRLLSIYNFEEKKKRESKLLSDFKHMISEKLDKIKK